MSVTLQIQSVFCRIEKNRMLRSLDSLANAIQVNRNTSGEVGEVSVLWGETSENASFSDAEITEISEKYKTCFRFSYTRLEGKGFAKGHNLLAANSKNDYLLILNPEAIVGPCLFHAMLTPFVNKQVAMVEARQTPLEQPKNYDKTTFETDWATMDCTVIPVALFTSLGGFDAESFVEAGCDVDLSWRVRQEGKTIFYSPNAVAFLQKRLDRNCKPMVTDCDSLQKRSAALMLAYKWSADQRFDELTALFEKDEIGKLVLKEFYKRKGDNVLPVRLDPARKIAKFVGDRYTEERYVL